jgi:hypothetical protein
MAQLTGAGGEMTGKGGYDMEIRADFSLLNRCSHCSDESSSAYREEKERKREVFLFRTRSFAIREEASKPRQ